MEITCTAEITITSDATHLKAHEAWDTLLNVWVMLCGEGHEPTEVIMPVTVFELLKHCPTAFEAGCVGDSLWGVDITFDYQGTDTLIYVCTDPVTGTMLTDATFAVGV